MTKKYEVMKISRNNKPVRCIRCRNQITEKMIIINLIMVLEGNPTVTFFWLLPLYIYPMIC
jgi:hypothetical protein